MRLYMIKTCAFCRQDKKLTKEHVWPSCFLDRVGRDNAHYSVKSGKVHGADYTVRDVCSECNNVHLAELDWYFCNLYDRHLSVPLGTDQAVSINYNHDMLCRVLLKIAYNTARSAGSESAQFFRLLPYVLRGGNCPAGVALIAELVSPTYIADTSGPIALVKEILPTMYRSALGQLLTPHGRAVVVRVVAVNSFFFHLLLARNPENLQSFEMARIEFLSGIQGAVPLDPNAQEVHLRSSLQDSLSSMLPLITAKRDQYREFFEHNNKRKGTEDKQ
jgi:hypothetical protein